MARENGKLALDEMDYNYDKNEITAVQSENMSLKSKNASLEFENKNMKEEKSMYC